MSIRALFRIETVVPIWHLLISRPGNNAAACRSALAHLAWQGYTNFRIIYPAWKRKKNMVYVYLERRNIVHTFFTLKDILRLRSFVLWRRGTRKSFHCLLCIHYLDRSKTGPGSNITASHILQTIQLNCTLYFHV